MTGAQQEHECAAQQDEARTVDEDSRALLASTCSRCRSNESSTTDADRLLPAPPFNSQPKPQNLTDSSTFEYISTLACTLLLQKTQALTKISFHYWYTVVFLVHSRDVPIDRSSSAICMVLKIAQSTHLKGVVQSCWGAGMLHNLPAAAWRSLVLIVYLVRCCG